MDFAMLHWTMVRYGVIFYPYYAVLATAGLYHTVSGLNMSRYILGITPVSSSSLNVKGYPMNRGWVAAGGLALCVSYGLYVATSLKNIPVPPAIFRR